MKFIKHIQWSIYIGVRNHYFQTTNSNLFIYSYVEIFNSQNGINKFILSYTATWSGFSFFSPGKN